jgi:DNA replication protein DnaC
MASEERDRLLQNLRRLSLPHAAQNIDEHLKQAGSLKLGHLAFLARVVEAEILARQRTRTDRRMRYAEFPEVCRIEDYDFKQQPCLDRKVVLNLAELGFVDRCEAVLWIGPSGVGKTHLSIGLGVRACEAGYNVRFVRAYPMLRRLYASLADDTLEETLDELAKPDLLIIDELGNSPKKHEDDLAGVFFELVVRRYRRGAIILATNLGFDQWSTYLGSPSQVTPAIDRLIEGAHVIVFPPDAESYRAKRKDGPGPLPSKKKGAARRRPPPDAPPTPP